MPAEFDVVVVGAGPAGSIAALQLARAGARVRLLDRAAFPRHKLCGDTVNPGALALLERLGVAARVRGRALRVTGMTVTGPNQAMVSADYPGGLCGLAIRRCDLDITLVEAATAAGVQFDPGVSVLGAVRSDGGGGVTGVRMRYGSRETELRTRMVVAADGRASRLASELALSRFPLAPRRWAYGAYFAGVTGLTSRGEMHIRSDGYLGIARLPRDLANVCLVTPLARASRGADFAQVLADGVATTHGLRERFAAAERISPVTVLGPLAVESRAAGCPGLLLAGDAAGFVDPMTGDGMRFAIRGAELAADAALRELATGVPSFAALTAARAREFAVKWRVNRALRALVGSPRALGLAARAARRWAAPVEYLIGVAGDVSHAAAARE